MTGAQKSCQFTFSKNSKYTSNLIRSNLLPSKGDFLGCIHLSLLALKSIDFNIQHNTDNKFATTHCSNLWNKKHKNIKGKKKYFVAGCTSIKSFLLYREGGCPCIGTFRYDTVGYSSQKLQPALPWNYSYQQRHQARQEEEQEAASFFSLFV